MPTIWSASVPSSEGLIFLPYLTGERTPYPNPNAKGVFFGLTIRHTRSDMIRAVPEGITFNLCIILDAFRKQGTPIQAMRVIESLEPPRGPFFGSMIWVTVFSTVSAEAPG